MLEFPWCLNHHQSTNVFKHIFTTNEWLVSSRSLFWIARNATENCGFNDLPKDSRIIESTFIFVLLSGCSPLDRTASWEPQTLHQTLEWNRERNREVQSHSRNFIVSKETRDSKWPCRSLCLLDFFLLISLDCEVGDGIQARKGWSDS